MKLDDEPKKAIENPVPSSESTHDGESPPEPAPKPVTPSPPVATDEITHEPAEPTPAEVGPTSTLPTVEDATNDTPLTTPAHVPLSSDRLSAPILPPSGSAATCPIELHSEMGSDDEDKDEDNQSDLEEDPDAGFIEHPSGNNGGVDTIDLTKGEDIVFGSEFEKLDAYESYLDEPNPWHSDLRRPLFPAQIIGFRWMNDRHPLGGGLIADKVGCGKV